MQNCDIELDHDINKGINIKQVALETIEQNFYKINLLAYGLPESVNL
jgi:hypothetical protein